MVLFRFIFFLAYNIHILYRYNNNGRIIWSQQYLYLMWCDQVSGLTAGWHYC